MVRGPPASAGHRREVRAPSLGQEDALEEEMATHLSMLAWEIQGRTWKKSESHSVVSDSLRPHGLYSPWNSPGQNTGVGSLSLLQGIFPTQGSNPGLLHCRQILYQLSHKWSPRNNLHVINNLDVKFLIAWAHVVFSAGCEVSLLVSLASVIHWHSTSLTPWLSPYFVASLRGEAHWGETWEWMQLFCTMLHNFKLSFS